MKQLCVFLILFFSFKSSDAQNPAIFTVQTDKTTADVQPTMWGVFFEDINLGADGGMYAELIKNRSFEFFKPMMGWKVMRPKNTTEYSWQIPVAAEKELQILSRKEKNANNPRYLHIVLNNHKKGDLGLQNEGFRGMGIKKGLRYDFSVFYRATNAAVKAHLELLNEKNEVIGKGELTFPNTEGGEKWTKVESNFTTTEGAVKGKFNIWFEGTGMLDLDIVSLFPSDTWKGRKGGMRADMIQLLADLKPGFIRFPGGCIVEGNDLSQRYQWKKTVGAVEDRQVLVNRWNFEFAHRPTPDYYQTFGLGFFEYFQIAEDIGAEPLPILNCGMSCQFNSAEMAHLDEIDPYIQDALDLVEFANGAVNTTWGALRAKMGHPEPFNLKMMGIGNENWGPQYIERLALFQKAIKDKYPTIKLVCSSGTDPDGERFNYLNGELRKMKADLIDEHYYRRPEWFLSNANRYDSYDRKSVSKVFAGEYAGQSVQTVDVNNKNNWRTAIAEAAFLTGLERNADVVNMASYAPLFAHIDGWQWTPNLIWVDNLRSYGTANYQVQKMFSTNKGTQVIPILYKNNAPATGQDSLYASATKDKNTGELIVKIVNTLGKAQKAEIKLDGNTKFDTKGHLLILKSDDLEAVNSLDNPSVIAPKETTMDIKGKNVALTLEPYSFTVIKLKIF
ncbi:MAG: alpha-L-arabinofuranosidase [Saprospiraceae bacterium]|nr:alpha-L-arabinofuranosidase [Saprospiraceae bacterium]